MFSYYRYFNDAESVHENDTQKTSPVSRGGRRHVSSVYHQGGVKNAIADFGSRCIDPSEWAEPSEDDTLEITEFLLPVLRETRPLRSAVRGAAAYIH